MFYDVISQEFEDQLARPGADLFCKVSRDTVQEWADRLVRASAEAARVHGGWIPRRFRWGGRHPEVFLIRLGSTVYGIVQMENARRERGRWSSGLIDMQELERAHQKIFEAWHASEILAAWTSRKGSPSLSDRVPPQGLTTDLDLV